MENLATKINKFIRSVDFEADGSLSVTVQKEFEITLEDGSIVKQPWQGERIILSIDDPKTEEIAGFFKPVYDLYWKIYKEVYKQNI